jgi:hypothetical protein
MFSTIATLMFVPVVFSLVHKKQGAAPANLVSLDERHAEAAE